MIKTYDLMDAKDPSLVLFEEGDYDVSIISSRIDYGSLIVSMMIDNHPTLAGTIIEKWVPLKSKHETIFQQFVEHLRRETDRGTGNVGHSEYLIDLKLESKIELASSFEADPPYRVRVRLKHMYSVSNKSGTWVDDCSKEQFEATKSSKYGKAVVKYNVTCVAPPMAPAVLAPKPKPVPKEESALSKFLDRLQ
jgi:hypothetical protein